jgi:hypothetical protein
MMRPRITRWPSPPLRFPHLQLVFGQASCSPQEGSSAGVPMTARYSIQKDTGIVPQA